MPALPSSTRVIEYVLRRRNTNGAYVWWPIGIPTSIGAITSIGDQLVLEEVSAGNFQWVVLTSSGGGSSGITTLSGTLPIAVSGSGSIRTISINAESLFDLIKGWIRAGSGIGVDAGSNISNGIETVSYTHLTLPTICSV